MSFIARALALVIFITPLAGCKQEKPSKASRAPARKTHAHEPDDLKVEELVEGTGKKPKHGDKVKVHYTGYLTSGKKFDSSVDRAEPFTFTVGKGQVIKGWDEAVVLMSVGGKYRVTVPPHMGYGKKGSGLSIPPDATLIFEIELLAVK